MNDDEQRHPHLPKRVHSATLNGLTFIFTGGKRYILKKTLRKSIRRTFFINRASPFGHFRVHSAKFRVHSATLLVHSASFRVHSAAIRAHSAWIRVHSAGESIRQKIVDIILNYIGRFSACNNFSGFELSKPLFLSVILDFNFFRWW